MDPLDLPQQNFSGTSGGGELSLYQYFIGSPLFAKFVDFEGSDRKVFLTQYVSLSSSLKNYLASTDTATTITTVGLNYNLDDGQISKIAETIRELIIGKIFIKDFPITISSKLGIDDIKAGEIVNKIVSQSFGPIIEDIKRIQRSKFPDKVMAMQKESQPTGLTRPGVGEARSTGAAQPAGLNRPGVGEAPPKGTAQPTQPSPAPQAKSVPPTQPNASQNVQLVRPPVTVQPPIRPSQPIPPAPPIPATPPLPQPSRPPLQMSPKPFDSIQSKPASPATPPNKPVSQPQQNPTNPPIIPSQPVQPLDLAQIKQNRPPAIGEARPEGRQFKMPDLGSSTINNEQRTLQQGQRTANTSQQSPPQAQKSLEEELEKVANVIDLRSKEQGT